MIRVVLPYHLRNLAKVGDELQFDIPEPATIGKVLDAIEERYPVLRGAIRDHGTLKRRPFVRFFACKEDLSHEPVETPLPEAVVRGEEPFMVVGAIAGG
jgi:molybdopterin synthase sulfur carrier subunit